LSGRIEGARRDRADAAISGINDLTETLIRCNERITPLESRIAFVTDPDRKAVRFFKENEEDGAAVAATSPFSS